MDLGKCILHASLHLSPPRLNPIEIACVLKKRKMRCVKNRFSRYNIHLPVHIRERIALLTTNFRAVKHRIILILKIASCDFLIRMAFILPIRRIRHRNAVVQRANFGARYSHNEELYRYSYYFKNS